jgi:hypothetical protein
VVGGLRRVLVCAIAAIAAFAGLGGSASAGLLTTGGASSCDPASQPFAPWGDYANYIPVPGGSFESGAPSWKLAGGASVVAGNEPYYVRSSSDRRSLYMPAGSTATSPTVCFAFGDWHMRFFTRNGGSSLSTLKIQILVPNLVGVVSVLDGGTVRADGTWDPSPQVSALLTNVGGLLGVTQAVAFRFRASSGAAFRVDDVYLDPFKGS